MARILFLAVLLSFSAWAEPVLEQTLAACNQLRAQYGLRPLELDPKLCRVALQHSQEMDRLGYFAHRSPRPEYIDLATRLRREDCFQLTFAENLYRGDGLKPGQVADEALRCWLESPVHRRNLLNPRFNRMGLGISVSAGGQYTITQDLAYQAVEVTEKSVRGGVVSLRCRVTDGPRQGAILWDGQRRLNWQADEQGRFTVEVEVPGSGTLAIGQAQAEREWSVETELNL